MSKYLVGSVVLALLSGCGLFSFERRAPWRDEAERACNAAGAVQPSAFVESARTISGPGACGMLQPWKISALAGGSVTLSSKAVLACPIVPQIDRWIGELLQPAAELYFGSRVVEMRAGSYSCRGMNNQAGASLSEHAFGNAVDIMSFRFSDGRELTVERGWRGSQAEQEFLREVFVGSCRYFTTVLGPGSDMFHYNHIHLDLARHSRDRHICKPIIKFTPRIDPDVAMTPRPPTQPVQQAMPPDPGGLYPELGESGAAGRYGGLDSGGGEEAGEPGAEDAADGQFLAGTRPPGGVGAP